MLNIVLLEPEIPQNTGNIARTCAVLNANLHLIGPMGFTISEKSVKRAGLDYWPLVRLHTYDSWQHFVDYQTNEDSSWNDRAFYLTTKGIQRYDKIEYPEHCFIIFGKESAGIPLPILQAAGNRAIRIPMRPELRSLNLSNAVAICAFEVFRQWDFPDMETQGILATMVKD